MHSDMSLSGDSDHQLLSNLKLAGAEKRIAEEQLFRKYVYFIREGIKKYALSEDDAFDAYSDTILSLIRAVTQGVFGNRSSLKTYLYSIFNNRCVDVLRKRMTNKNSVHRTSSIDDMQAQLSDTAKSIVLRMVEQTNHDSLKLKLNELGETCRSMLMQFADGRSDKEIADFTKYKSADVVKTTRLRCLGKLRQLYKSDL